MAGNTLRKSAKVGQLLPAVAGGDKAAAKPAAAKAASAAPVAELGRFAAQSDRASVRGKETL